MVANGSRLGSYEIISALGAGGMGEVYRARDTRLGRDVAIKIVSDGFGHDPERVARFQREAHLLAALNHPHIAAIYGLEEANGSQFLVLELVEGETLAERLKDGPIPVSQALTITRQIGDALQAAHEKGIIHRDLKPANIAFAADGQVKVLDFGLAKAVEAESRADVSNSPTMTLSGTQAGVILGTAAYMSPEQAKGRAADKRTDVWAFGCVLYETLTGKRAFEGEDVGDTLAAVLRGEPNWSALPNDTSPVVRTLVQRCLEKDRRQRIADISTVNFLLTESANLAPDIGSMMLVSRPAMWRRIAIPIGMWFLGAAIVGTGVWLAMLPVPPRVSRLQITPPPTAAPTITALTIQGATRDIAITPDGTRVVYTGANGTTLFVRALDQLEAAPLTGLGSPVGPFISPDGQWIGFTDASSLKRVAITGGAAVPLVRLDGAFRGATWLPDGTIVFATNNGATGLQSVTPSGETTVLTRPDPARGENDHLWPEILPGGQALLFTIAARTGGLDQAQVAVLDLRTKVQTTLIPGASDAHYVPGGYLVYGAAGTLRAVGFDLGRLAVIGTAVPVLSQVVTTNAGGVNVAVADNGTLVYVPGGVGAQQRTPTWVDWQSGQETPIHAPPHAYDQPRISPDGVRIALHAQDDGDIWLWDLVRSAPTRFTADPAQDNFPVWTLDGRLIFNSGRAGAGRAGGAANLFAQAANGTGIVTQLTKSPNTQRATSLSPDGTRLVFTETNPGTDDDVMQLQLDGTHEITPLVQTRSVEWNGEISGDGHWLAYEANDSGSFEIFVRSFPDIKANRWQVSTGGGRQPLWARSGVPELFYLAPTGALMRVRGPQWDTAVPEQLLDVKRYYTGTAGQVGRAYDIDSKGGRFLLIKPGGESESTPAPTSLVVVQHFDEDLKRLVPVK